MAHLMREIPVGINHVIIDNHYPINKEKNRREIRQICESFGAIYVDSGRDLGLHEGLNHMTKKVGMGANDILIGCDPDDRPSPGSISAMDSGMRALKGNVAVLALNFSVIKDRVNQGVPFRKLTVDGKRVLLHPSVEMWTVAAFDMGFIYGAGGFKQTYAYYGGLESALYGYMAAQGKALGYLQDFDADHLHLDRNDPTLFDPEYRMWKNAHLSGFSGSFEEWLIHSGRESLIHGA